MIYVAKCREIQAYLNAFAPRIRLLVCVWYTWDEIG